MKIRSAGGGVGRGFGHPRFQMRCDSRLEPSWCYVEDGVDMSPPAPCSVEDGADMWQVQGYDVLEIAMPVGTRMRSGI